MHLDLNKLHVFREVARAGSYTVAARHLHVTQSAVSHAVRKLEQSVGAPLIEWRSRTLHLTEQGEVLYRSSERVFTDLEEVEELLLGDRLPRIAIRIGATVEFGTTVLIRKLGPLLRARPELHVDYVFSHDVATLLLRDEVDIAVDCHPVHHPSITSSPLFREKYVVIASDEFLSRHLIESPADLSNVPVLSLDKSGDWWGNFLRALPRTERPALEQVVEVNHIRGIINAALDGQGVGFVPTYAVIAELEDNRLRRLFPDLILLEDRFSIIQKRGRAGRAKNQLVTEYLLGLDASEFGDAMEAVGE